MGAVDKLFGLALLVGGIFIAIYWTLWVLMILVSSLSINLLLYSPSSQAKPTG